MDLISREVVKEQAKASYHVAESMEELGNLYEDCIDALPSAFGGMTNGEVVQAVFDVMVLTVKDGKVWVEKIYFPFDLEWWNTPYQKGGGK